MKTFYRWTEAVVYLKNLIRQATPLAGEGIVVENTPHGQRISRGSLSDSSGYDYNGPFHVVDYSDEETLIVGVEDGMDVEYMACGYYANGFERVQVPAPDPIVLDRSAGSVTVYVKITHDGTNYGFEFDTINSSTLPQSENGTVYRAIALVVINHGMIIRICQIQMGDLMAPGVM